MPSLEATKQVPQVNPTGRLGAADPVHHRIPRPARLRHRDSAVADVRDAAGNLVCRHRRDHGGLFARAVHLRADPRTHLRSHRTPPGDHAGTARLVVGYLIYGFAGSFIGLFLSRAVHGACAATISTAQAYIADTTDEIESRARNGNDRRCVRTRLRHRSRDWRIAGAERDLRIPGFFAAALTFANLIIRGVPTSRIASA